MPSTETPKYLFAELPPGDFESPGLVPNPDFVIEEEDRTDPKVLLCNCGVEFLSTPVIWRGKPAFAPLFCPACDRAHAEYIKTMRGKPVRPEPEESIPATSKEKKPLSPLEAKLARINSQRKLNAGCHIMSDTPTASPVPESMPCNDPQSRPESTTPSLSTPSSIPGDMESLPASSAAEISSTGKPSEPAVPTSGEATNAAPHALREHAKHSPSSHKPKSICPGFRNEDTDEWKKFSDRGEAGHEALEKEDLSLCKDDIDLRNAVSKCLAYIKQFPGKPHRELKIKTLYEWGFVDRVHIGEHAHLFDPKFVLNRYYANSAQFWDYAIGVFKKFPEVQKITVHVLMPFLDLIDTETWTRQEDLPVLVQRVATIVARAVADDPSTYKVNENCRFCERASQLCPALAEFGAHVASLYQGKPLALPDGSVHGSEITAPNAIAMLLDIKPVVEKMAEGWGRAATRLWQEGNEIPGYKLVTKDSARTVTNTETLWDILSKDFGVTPEEAMKHATIPLGAAEDLVAARAPKGRKGAAKDELQDRLLDRDAIKLGTEYSYLIVDKKQRAKKEQ